MRISSQMIYDSIKLELARKNQDLLKANRIVATGKRLNRLSDDPASLVQNLGVRSSVSNLNQLEKNITRAKTWLDVGDTVLTSVKDLVSDARHLCYDLNGGTSLRTTDQAFAVSQVNGILVQIQQLANTMVDGQYLFAGTKTDAKPFELDDDQNPTTVTYAGNNNDFEILIGKDTTIAVGHDGEEIFGDSFIVVNDTNNKIDFVEDPSPVPGDESVLEATIPSGKYTAAQLVTAMENAMEGVSANGVDYIVTYDSGIRQFSIQDNGTLNELQLLWETGSHAGTSIGSDLGFGETGDSIGSTSYSGSSEVQWGIFKTLIELRDCVATDDVNGINRSITRLNTHLDNLIGKVSEKIISKQVHLDMRENLVFDLRFRYDEIRSRLEDADMTEAIMDLKSKEFAYQAALESAARVMEMSLVDFL